MADVTGVVLAVSSGHVDEVTYVEAGTLWAADHPIVKANPDFFSDDLEPVIRRPEKRTTKRG